MPYRRRNYRRTFRKRYRKKQSKWGGYMSTAMKALSIANQVRSVINTEYKYKDPGALNDSINNAAWAVYPISNIAEGDDSFDRNGRSVLAKSFGIRTTISLGGSLDHAAVRIMLVKYNSCKGANPTIGDILVTTTGAQAVNSFRNILTANVKYYTILWDKRFSLDKDFKSEITLEKYWKLKFHCKYIDTTGNVSGMGENALFLLVISDNPSHATDNVNLTFTSRFRYIDN